MNPYPFVFVELRRISRLTNEGARSTCSEILRTDYPALKTV